MKLWITYLAFLSLFMSFLTQSNECILILIFWLNCYLFCFFDIGIEEKKENETKKLRRRMNIILDSFPFV